jgi:hypothetical protein
MVGEDVVRQERQCGSFQGMPSGMPRRRLVMEAALAAALPAKASG